MTAVAPLKPAQLGQVAQATARNARDLAADSRLLLEAKRFPRAHALAVLALEELGKVQLCREALAGRLDDNAFRSEWSSHKAKLDRSRIASTLFAPTIDRVFATVDDDSAMKLRGLYVDLPDGPDAGPVTPTDVRPIQARDMVETAEAAIDLMNQRM